jgi:hypothetical protein
MAGIIWIMKRSETGEQVRYTIPIRMQAPFYESIQYLPNLCVTSS